MDNPYEWLQRFIEQVPAILQPLIVAAAGMVPYIEGEGSAALGIIAGINPVVAAVAGASGNILCVLGVVFLGARIRDRAVARRSTAQTENVVDDSLGRSSNNISPDAALSGVGPVGVLEERTDNADAANAKPTRRQKGRVRLERWMVRFGVPGASILAPLALPTMLTAAFFVGSGVPKKWVILWQVVAIILWTSAVAIAATGALTLLGW